MDPSRPPEPPSATLLPPPPPAPTSTSDGPGWVTVTLVTLALLATFAGAAVAFGVSWFASCGPGLIGYSDPGPPDLDTLQSTLFGYVVAFVVAASVPAIALFRAIRKSATTSIVLWATLLGGVAVLIAPSIVDVSAAVAAGEPGNYCIQPGYQGG